MFGKVAVLYGGSSSEREISLKSGKRVLNSLRQHGINAYGIDAINDYITTLITGNFSRVFIALHGGLGENGSVQGLLECLNLPYTGTKVLGSAICMDKVRTKRIWEATGLPTAPFTILDSQTQAIKLLQDFSGALAVKPVYGGSTLGISKVTKYTEFAAALEYAKDFGLLMAEQWIYGEEYSVPILGNQALPAIKIVAKDNFYDYTAKYVSKDTQFICPAPLSEKEEHNLRKLAFTAFNVLGGSGFGRIDLIKDVNGNFWLLEANTIPGLTENSLLPMSAQQIGLNFTDLLLKILSQTLDVPVTVI